MKQGEKLLRIGVGAAFSDDRIPPAVDLAERGELDYLVFECLAERTIALAQSPSLGCTSIAVDLIPPFAVALRTSILPSPEYTFAAAVTAVLVSSPLMLVQPVIPLSISPFGTIVRTV